MAGLVRIDQGEWLASNGTRRRAYSASQAGADAAATPRIRYHALEAVDGAGADLAVVPITLLIGPNNDIDHELASRADRILLQWTTPAWLLIGIWVGRQRSPDEGLPR